MKAETLFTIAAMICPLGTRPVTVHAVTPCKETGGTKETWFTFFAGADGVKASIAGGYAFKGGASYRERLNRIVSRHTGTGQIYLSVSIKSIPERKSDGKRQTRSIYRDGAGRIVPAPPKKERARGSEWFDIPYKVENVKSIRYAGKTYT